MKKTKEETKRCQKPSKKSLFKTKNAKKLQQFHKKKKIKRCKMGRKITRKEGKNEKKDERKDKERGKIQQKGQKR